MLSVLRSAYAWLLLSLIMLPLFPAAWIFAILTSRLDPDRARLRGLVAAWVSVYARLTPLYRFRIEGGHRLPREPHVLIANHESGLDVLVLMLIGTRARFVAERWLFRVPLAGRLLRACRHIAVRPGDRQSGHAALQEAGEALAGGTPVALFPEGVLCPDGLGDFRPGAFVLARRAGVPIVPVLIEGAGRAWRPGTMVVRGCHEIRVAVLPPIDPMTAPDPAALASRVRSELTRARRLSEAHHR